MAFKVLTIGEAVDLVAYCLAHGCTRHDIKWKKLNRGAERIKIVLILKMCF